MRTLKGDIITGYRELECIGVHPIAEGSQRLSLKLITMINNADNKLYFGAFRVNYEN